MGLFSILPSTSTLYSAYATISSSIVMGRSIVNEIIPQENQVQIGKELKKLFGRRISSYQPLTLVIKKREKEHYYNEVYEAAELYLGSKITPSVNRLRVFKHWREDSPTVLIDVGEEITDVFEGINLRWTLLNATTKGSGRDNGDGEYSSGGFYYELEFDKKYKDTITNSYLPCVLKRLKEMEDKNRKIYLYKLSSSCDGDRDNDRTHFEHPATFDTLALDEKLKKEIMEDLERFVKRKDYYKRVGRAWKRGYLLYGPPGTGKSTLIAAMANYLKIDVYDLELATCGSNDDLRECLQSVDNKSILVIEDIDCSVTLESRQKTQVEDMLNTQLTLSGVLNMIDGLWSSCGDERIIIFTTNHKERLDPALLRPGRMDMHIHMSYCTKDAFSTLAKTYLGIPKDDKNKLYLETKDWIEKCQVTAAEIAEELMKSEDVEIALGGLLEFLKQKKNKQDEAKDDDQGVAEQPAEEKLESKRKN